MTVMDAKAANKGFKRNKKEDFNQFWNQSLDSTMVAWLQEKQEIHGSSSSTGKKILKL